MERCQIRQSHVLRNRQATEFEDVGICMWRVWLTSKSALTCTDVWIGFGTSSNTTGCSLCWRSRGSSLVKPSKTILSSIFVDLWSYFCTLNLSREEHHAITLSLKLSVLLDFFDVIISGTSRAMLLLAAHLLGTARRPSAKKLGKMANSLLHLWGIVNYASYHLTFRRTSYLVSHRWRHYAFPSALVK